MPPRTNKHRKGVRGRRQPMQSALCQCDSLLELNIEPLLIANGCVTLEWLKPVQGPIMMVSWLETLRFPIFNTCSACPTNAFMLTVENLDLNVSVVLNEAMSMVQLTWTPTQTMEIKVRCPAFDMMRDVPDNISFRELRLMYLGDYSLSENGEFNFTERELDVDMQKMKVLLLYVRPRTL